jgi:peptidoglycan/LPS O-acetylase OafA/YrhL
MLVVVTAAASVIEPAQEASLRSALLAAVTYTSNWYQILHHVSYFDAFTQLTTPARLDHFGRSPSRSSSFFSGPS